MIEITIDKDRFWIDKLPESCPFCHKLVTPDIKASNYNTSATDTHKDLITLELFVVCSNILCQNSYIGYYNMICNNEFEFSNTSKGVCKKRVFSTQINSMSKKFSVIYNQAYAAEQNDLFEICGMGYRKALEFLIIDYYILLNPNNQHIIGETFISSIINEFIEDDVFKQVSLRAIWLCNDETHYARKHKDYNLNDIKKIIDSVVSMIESKMLYNKIIVDMPYKTKQ